MNVPPESAARRGEMTKLISGEIRIRIQVTGLFCGPQYRPRVPVHFHRRCTGRPTEVIYPQVVVRVWTDANAVEASAGRIGRVDEVHRAGWGIERLNRS